MYLYITEMRERILKNVGEKISNNETKNIVHSNMEWQRKSEWRGNWITFDDVIMYNVSIEVLVMFNMMNNCGEF